MKLNDKEKEICEKYSARDADGYVHCSECPLVIPGGVYDCTCYATIDGRSKEAKRLRRVQ